MSNINNIVSFGDFESMKYFIHFISDFELKNEEVLKSRIYPDDEEVYKGLYIIFQHLESFYFNLGEIDYRKLGKIEKEIYNAFVEVGYSEAFYIVLKYLTLDYVLNVAKGKVILEIKLC